uniref:Uncharacterized protein n=1 Tax=Anguilla anguilla TaxID=7936 RepID=A0A0E9XCQ4_ANGAN
MLLFFRFQRVGMYSDSVVTGRRSPNICIFIFCLCF